jgi:hypothetical protein
MSLPEPDSASKPAGTTPEQLLAAALERREEAAALIAERRLASRRARALVQQKNAILDSAVAIVEAVLARRRIALAEPVAAAFRDDGHGSHGIELTVRVQDPASAPAARHALVERFGGEAPCDRLIVA